MIKKYCERENRNCYFRVSITLRQQKNCRTKKCRTRFRTFFTIDIDQCRRMNDMIQSIIKRFNEQWRSDKNFVTQRTYCHEIRNFDYSKTVDEFSRNYEKKNEKQWRDKQRLQSQIDFDFFIYSNNTFRFNLRSFVFDFIFLQQQRRVENDQRRFFEITLSNISRRHRRVSFVQKSSNNNRARTIDFAFIEKIDYSTTIDFNQIEIESISSSIRKIFDFRFESFNFFFKRWKRLKRMQTKISRERFNNRNFLNYVKNDHHRFDVTRRFIKNN